MRVQRGVAANRRGGRARSVDARRLPPRRCPRATGADRPSWQAGAHGAARSPAKDEQLRQCLPTAHLRPEGWLDDRRGRSRRLPASRSSPFGPAQGRGAWTTSPGPSLPPIGARRWDIRWSTADRRGFAQPSAPAHRAVEPTRLPAQNEPQTSGRLAPEGSASSRRAPSRSVRSPKRPTTRHRAGRSRAIPARRCARHRRRRRRASPGPAPSTAAARRRPNPRRSTRRTPMAIASATTHAVWSTKPVRVAPMTSSSDVTKPSRLSGQSVQPTEAGM